MAQAFLSQESHICDTWNYNVHDANGTKCNKRLLFCETLYHTRFPVLDFIDLNANLTVYQVMASLLQWTVSHSVCWHWPSSETLIAERTSNFSTLGLHASLSHVALVCAVQLRTWPSAIWSSFEVEHNIKVGPALIAGLSQRSSDDPTNLNWEPACKLSWYQPLTWAL